MSSVTIFFGLVLFGGTTIAVKDRVDGSAKRAIISIKSAVGSIAQSDFTSSNADLENAYQEFIFASDEMNKINSFAKFISRFIPGASKLSSGSNIIEAGKYLTHTAKELHSIIPEVINEDHALVSTDGKHVSFLALYRLIADRMDIARYDLAAAQKHIDQVYVDDVPEEYRDSFVQMKELLPEINNSLRIATESRATVESMLGAQGPRTYLFLFENNQEMRATGGFIGSYGIVKINNGRIEKMIVDDIYNPDGQLTDRVVPPLPIQKISANWSMHDSNWFADFPISAKKAMDFYERTGGPTVDGVIAITPEMLGKFLQITGPVQLQNRDVKLTHENYIVMLQDEIENRENYGVKSNVNDEVKSDESIHSDTQDDKEHKEQPKQILGEVMPILVDRLFDRKNPGQLSAVATSIANGLKERHIIIYMTHPQAQEIILNNGWGGKVPDTDKDYLSVINANINGFKTDGVINETITHNAEIDEDGSIIDTVRIQREHTGGHTGYPWWDGVNSNYMRVYVPEGSQLISVEGQTREINTPRLSYDALGYLRDKDIEAEENGMYIDEETGTRIYDDAGKTVFANWVYVSPQETVTVTYKYRLPFLVNFEQDDVGDFGSYAILVQKQSGSTRSSIDSTIDLPDNLFSVWHSHDDANLHISDDLKIDRYNGVVFREKK